MTKEVVTCCFGTPSLPRSGAGAGERWWRDSGEAGKNRKGALWWQEGSGAKQVASTREFTLILICVCQICNDWGPSFSAILPLLEQVKYVAKWARNDTYKSCNLYILKCICLAVVHENYENEKRNQSPVITLLVLFLDVAVLESHCIVSYHFYPPNVRTPSSIWIAENDVMLQKETR